MGGNRANEREQKKTTMIKSIIYSINTEKQFHSPHNNFLFLRSKSAYSKSKSKDLLLNRLSDLREIINSKSTTFDDIKKVLGRLTNVSYIFFPGRFFLNRIRNLHQRCEKYEKRVFSYENVYKNALVVWSRGSVQIGALIVKNNDHDIHHTRTHTLHARKISHYTIL